MKILISHRYYWPDTPPYGLMLKKIAENLDSTHHSVSVFSTKPSYHSTSKDSKKDIASIKESVVTKRISVLDEHKTSSLTRGMNALWYGLRLFIEIIRSKPEVVLASTFPPIVAALSAGLACKIVGAKFVYHLMDVYPEVAFLGKQESKLFKLLKYADNVSISLAEILVVLSDDMKTTLIARGLDGSKIVVINNLEVRDSDDAGSPNENLLSLLTHPRPALRICFAGNIGVFQGLDYVASLVQSTSGCADIEYVFMGEGRYKSTLEEKLAALVGTTVHFIEQQPISVARALMANSDLNIVSLSPGVSNCSFPSKTITIAAEGAALLILDQKGSSLAEHVKSYKAGIFIQYDEASTSSRRLIELAENKCLLEEFRTGSKKMYKECFAEGVTLNQWQELIGGLDT